MAYTTTGEWGGNFSEGAHQLLLYVSDVVPSFIPIMLFSLFVIILMGTYYSQRRLTGRGNFPGSFTVAALVTFFTALVLSLTAGLINVFILVTTLALLIVGVVWLMFTRD